MLGDCGEKSRNLNRASSICLKKPPSFKMEIGNLIDFRSNFVAIELLSEFLLLVIALVDISGGLLYSTVPKSRISSFENGSSSLFMARLQKERPIKITCCQWDINFLNASV